MLQLPDWWTWDLWTVSDHGTHHAFQLKAPRAVAPADRHHHARLGHAVSTDLTNWTVLPDVLEPAGGPAFDDRSIWTGSVIRNPAGGWRMFYTGINRRDSRQRIGIADSPDLMTWSRGTLLLEADPRWYEADSWRDPWVFPDPAGAGWHMLITARAGEGVVGHAHSPDLTTWTVGPPLSGPGAGFGHLEVMQPALVEERPVLVFSCLEPELSGAARAAHPGGGTWALPLESALESALESPLGSPLDLRLARLLTGPECYAGRVVARGDGSSVLLGFRHDETATTFTGGIIDPLRLSWEPGRSGRLSATPFSATSS